MIIEINFRIQKHSQVLNRNSTGYRGLVMFMLKRIIYLYSLLRIQRGKGIPVIGRGGHRVVRR
jgi:hypothetical protein